MPPKKKEVVLSPDDLRAISLAMCSSLSDSVHDQQPAQAFHRSDVHCRVYRRLRLSVVTAAKLGHRSCHAVWGSSGSGKTQVLRLLADSLRKVPGMFVVCLDGGTLQGDDEAVRCFVAELRSFFQSSSAAAFLAKHKSTIPAQLAELCDPPADSDPEDDVEPATSMSLPKRATLPHQALAVLQATLVAMNRGGVSMAVLIDRAARFATWCDRLMYILSGLMHEVDQRVGGMSLVLSSMCADMRGIEKRLSSRLTCEMCFLPRLQPPLTLLVEEAVEAAERSFSEASERMRQAATKMEGTGASRKRSREQQVAWAQRMKDLELQAEELSRLARLAPKGRDSVLRLIGPRVEPALLAACAGLDEAKGHVLRGISAFGTPQPTTEAPPPPIAVSAADSTGFCWGEDFVRYGYCSREALLLIAYSVLQADRGALRTFEDLVSDISTSLGTQATAQVDAFALQLALEQLKSWSMVEIQRRSQFVVLKGSVRRAREFVSTVLSSGSLSERCGLDTKERHSLSQLFR